MNPVAGWLYRYPFLRFDIPLIAGIALSGAGVKDYGWTLPACMAGCVLFLFFGATKAGYHVLKYKERWVFGMVLCVMLCLIGIWRTNTANRTVRVEWTPDNRVWQGWITGSGEEKKNSYMVPVEVEGKNIYLYLPKDSLSASLHCGEEILFHARIGKPLNRGDAQEFDYASYLYHNGISGTAYAGEGAWKKGSRIRPLTLKQKALDVRSTLIDRYRQWGLDGQELAVVAALTFGDSSLLDDSLREDYSTAGTSHVLALSGLHISIVVTVLGTLLLLTRRSSRHLWLRCIALIVMLWIFAFITGLSGSVVRSSVMFSIVLMGRCLHRQGKLINSLSFAAFVMLVYNPFYLYDVGFQLSFMAIVGIAMFNPTLYRLKKGTRWKWLGYVQDTICTSISAQLGVWPLVAFYFGNFPLYFIPANLIIIPLSFVVLILSLVVWVLSLIPLISCIHNLLATCLQLMVGLQNGIVSFTGGLPLASLPVECSPATLWLAYWISFCLWLIWKTRKVARPIIAACCGICLLLAHEAKEVLMPPPPSLLFYTDRSQRDIVRYQYNRHTVHIDSLATSRGIFAAGGNYLYVLENENSDFSAITSPLPLAALYVRKEFGGDFASIAPAFVVKRVVLEASVRYDIRRKIEHYCIRHGIEVINLRDTGAYRLEL